jgi:hypothetical protein
VCHPVILTEDPVILTEGKDLTRSDPVILTEDPVILTEGKDLRNFSEITFYISSASLRYSWFQRDFRNCL